MEGSSKKGFWIALLVAGLVMVLTIAVGNIAIDRSIQAHRSEFARMITAVQDRLGFRVKLYVDGLFTARALLDIDPTIKREQFIEFFESSGFRRRYPGILAVGYYRFVKDADLGTFLKTTKGGDSVFTFRPQISRGRDHLLIMFNESTDDDSSVRGFDILSEPIRAAAALMARDTGMPTMTPKIKLLLPSNTIDGFSIYLPIYRRGAKTDTIAERREAFLGVVGEVLRADEFFSSVFSRTEFESSFQGLDFEVFDDGILNEANLIYDVFPEQRAYLKQDEFDFSRFTTIEVNNHRWTLSYQMISDFAKDSMRMPILAIGGVISLLVFISIFSFSSLQSRAESLAAKMTGDLARYKLAVDNASSHVIITDIDGKIYYANQAATEITGYSNEEIIGQRPSLWGKQMSLEFYRQMWHQIKDERKPFKSEIKNKRKDGEVYTALLSISPILDEQNNLVGFVGLEDDISDRKRFEEKLASDARKLAEEKNRDEVILKSIGEGVVVVDKNGKVLIANPEAAKMLGLKVEEMLGKPYLELWMVKDGLGNTIASRPLGRTLTTGEIVSTGEYFYTRKDGDVFPVYLTISPVIQDGVIVGAIDVFRDISKEKAIDTAKTEFVSLASHQLRTPLSAINWYVEMLLSGDLGVIDQNQKKYLEEIYEASRRMVELVNSLLNVSRVDLGTFSIEPEELLVEKVARDVIADLKPQITYKKIGLVENYDTRVPMIQADVQLVRIIIQNLLSNAVKYTGSGGKVELEIKLIAMGETVGGRTAPNDSVLIRVSDNGYGIPESQHEKIFVKLFRADNIKVKDTEGTGLGLYIVKSIVDVTGGSIWFDSKEGVGTTFYVLIPTSGMQKRTGTKQLAL